MRTTKRSLKFAGLCLSVIFLLLPSLGYGAGQKTSHEQAKFYIYVSGKEVGQEKFSIQDSGDSISSSSTMSFRDPKTNQSAKKETELVMDNRLMPQSYKFRADIGGKTGSMKAVFTQGEAKFAYEAGGPPITSGLLVGDRYTVLDTNVFHHFALIARLFDLDSKEKVQSIEVVIPQELSNGILKISDAGFEKTDMRGKKKELHHLKADTGRVQIDLWIDAQHILYKIALPLKAIEVIRE
jgi:hypothetical protein